MSRRRALLAGWLAVLALSAVLPISAVYHGVVHIGTAPIIFDTPPANPIISVGSDVVLPRGARSTVIVVGAAVHIGGDVRDDVVALDGRIFLARGSRVRGDVLSIVGTTFKQSGARVDGQIGGSIRPWSGSTRPNGRDVAGAAVKNVRLGLAAGLALLLIGACLVIVFPWQVVLIATTLRDSPLKSVVAGLLSLLVFVFLVVPLGLSLVGLPFALLLTGAAGLSWLFGITSVSVVLGRKISRGPVSLVWASAAGLLALAVGLSVPFVGPVLVTALGLAGAGALAVALVNRAYPSAPVR